MLILQAKIALNAVIANLIYSFLIDNGFMITLKCHISSFVFTVLCVNYGSANLVLSKW